MSQALGDSRLYPATGASRDESRDAAGWRAAAAGAAAVLAAAACGRVAGQTVSLSTLDVRPAYGLSASVWTLPLSVLVVVIVHALPTAGVVAGMARWGGVPAAAP